MVWYKILLLILSFLVLIPLFIYWILFASNVSPIKVPNEYYERNTEKGPGKVVVSFSTLPSRIDNVQKILQNLEEQTVLPDLVFINIPHFSKRENRKYVIPPLKSSLNFYINRCEDMGPLTKVLPTLEKIRGVNDIIITIDDDEIYKKIFIERLVQGAKLFPDACVTFGGWNYTRFLWFVVNLLSFSNTRVDILQGYKGVVYRPHFFKKDFFTNYNRFSNCFTVDDIYISLHLKKYGIPIFKLQFNKNNDSPFNGKHSKTSSPLGAVNLRNFVWGKCIRELEDKLI